MTTTRRTLLGALLLSPSLARTRPDERPDVRPDMLPQAWAQLERSRGGRLGVSLLDTASGQAWRHRGAERFGLCSTFKLLLAGAVLQGIDQGRLQADARLPLREAERLSHMPSTEPWMARGWATPLELAEGAQVTSDNLAANVLLRALGGPEGFTRWLRGSGDAVTRIDRYEPEMNRVVGDDPRDTSSPEAFAASVARLCTGTGFHASMPDRLNDTAIFWPPGRTPWVPCCFYEGPAKSSDWVRPQDEAVLAEVGRLAAAAVGSVGSAAAPG